MSKRPREENETSSQQHKQHRHQNALSSSQHQSSRDSIQFLISFHISNKKCEQDVIRKVMAAINVEAATCKHDHRSGQFNRHLVTIPKISTCGNKVIDSSHLTLEKVKVMFAHDIAAKKFGVMEYNPVVALKGKLVRAEKHKKKRDLTLQKRRQGHQGEAENGDETRESCAITSEVADETEETSIQAAERESDAE